MEDNKSTRITFGSALAMVISYTTWKSVGWAIFHAHAQRRAFLFAARCRTCEAPCLFNGPYPETAGPWPPRRGPPRRGHGRGRPP